MPMPRNAVLLSRSNRNPAIAGAEVVQHVVFADLGDLQHRVDHFVRRRHEDHVQGAQFLLRFSCRRLRRAAGVTAPAETRGAEEWRRMWLVAYGSSYSLFGCFSRIPSATQFLEGHEAARNCAGGYGRRARQPDFAGPGAAREIAVDGAHRDLIGRGRRAGAAAGTRRTRARAALRRPARMPRGSLSRRNSRALRSSQTGDRA